MKATTGTPIATIYSSDTGIPFTMRLVRKGAGYGRDLAITHDKEDPLVEFYDARYKFEGERGAEFGQFVSRYYLSTLNRTPHGALNLEGSVSDWTIDEEGMRAAYFMLLHWEG